MCCMKYFDPERGSLIFIKEEANAEFWDKQWKPRDLTKLPSKKQSNSFVTRITEKYLKPSDGPLLEGGCGRGHYVSALASCGYDCTGLDYAKETVSDLNHHRPDLKILYGDVRELPFPPNAFSGYWSLGVIEHFWDGYDPIAHEMQRVIKPGGYLFLTFPQFSPLRALKARLGMYSVWKETATKPEGFYQFGLDPKRVAKAFEQRGFRLLELRQKDGVKGAKDEIAFLKPFLQKLYDYKGTNLGIRIIRKMSEIVLTPFAGHSVLLVLQKIKQL